MIKLKWLMLFALLFLIGFMLIGIQGCNSGDIRYITVEKSIISQTKIHEDLEDKYTFLRWGDIIVDVPKDGSWFYPYRRETGCVRFRLIDDTITKELFDEGELYQWK